MLASHRGLVLTALSLCDARMRDTRHCVSAESTGREHRRRPRSLRGSEVSRWAHHWGQTTDLVGAVHTGEAVRVCGQGFGKSTHSPLSFAADLKLKLFKIF